MSPAWLKGAEAELNVPALGSPTWKPDTLALPGQYYTPAQAYVFLKYYKFIAPVYIYSREIDRRCGSGLHLVCQQRAGSEDHPGRGARSGPDARAYRPTYIESGEIMIRRLLVIGLLVGWAGSVSAQDYMAKAKAAFAAKDTAAAVIQLELAVKNGQKAGEAHYYLGAVAFARKKYPDALEHAQAAVKANEENVDALKLLAEAQLKTKNTKGAIETLKRAEKLAKKDGVVLALLGRTMLADGQVDEAIRYLSLAKEYMPNEASIYVELWGTRTSSRTWPRWGSRATRRRSKWTRANSPHATSWRSCLRDSGSTARQ